MSVDQGVRGHVAPDRGDRSQQSEKDGVLEPFPRHSLVLGFIALQAQIDLFSG